MSYPKLNSGLVKKENPTDIILFFDSALDTSVVTPISSFLINYGKYAIINSRFISNSILSLTVSPRIVAGDEIFISYNPPVDLSTALRAPVRDPSDLSEVKRASVRQVSNTSIVNLIQLDERKEEWKQSSNLGGGEGEGVPAYPILKRGQTIDPTPDDFILMYGQKEAVQLSNIDDASACEINKSRIWMALQDACAYIDSYIEQATHSCFRIVSSNRRRTACIIARYYLDSVRRRKDVTEDYERCIKELNDACDNFEGPTNDKPLARDGRGILRTWRVPQMYNFKGKGLSGFWVDSSADREDDFRSDRDYYNAEANVPKNNSPRSERGNPSSQPNDQGGTNTNNG